MSKKVKQPKPRSSRRKEAHTALPSREEIFDELMGCAQMFRESYSEPGQGVRDRAALKTIKALHVAAAIIAAPEINWISVKDELPDEELTVLIATTDPEQPVFVGYLDQGIWRWDAFPLSNGQITHWSELPEPPKP